MLNSITLYNNKKNTIFEKWFLLTNNKQKNKLCKQNLGQFYTTNQEYILQGMQIPDGIKNIIEPFTGNGDLITFIEKEQEKIRLNILLNVMI